MHFKDLDLNLLYLLAVLFEERSVSKAAARLQVTQPSASSALAKLRKRFGDELFIRSDAGLIPTAYAETLREPVRQVLEKIDRDILGDQKFSPLATARTFRISTSDFGEVVLLPKLAELMHARAPNCSLHCISLPPHELAEQMERGNVDLAIGYFPDLGRNAFHLRELAEGRLICIVREGHPNVGDSLTLEQFESMGHVVATHEMRQLDYYEGRIRDLGLRRLIKLQVAHLMSVIPIIEATDYLAVVPRRMGFFSEKVRPLPVPIEMEPLKASIYWHHRSQSDPGTIWLRDLIAEATAIVNGSQQFRAKT